HGGERWRFLEENATGQLAFWVQLLWSRCKAFLLFLWSGQSGARLSLPDGRDHSAVPFRDTPIGKMRSREEKKEGPHPLTGL
ncbi:MAG: hypothetical protein WBD67_04755, partial [Terracidiphilus sp.]